LTYTKRADAGKRVHRVHEATCERSGGESVWARPEPSTGVARRGGWAGNGEGVRGAHRSLGGCMPRRCRMMTPDGVARSLAFAE
jgi:hypothetical protein